eukprot:TRINITY_DN5148_c0_g2_i1.p1 TRINITY_DN5148_c0_g2~~TRINITY_DN5148_c0_g2_i1.p1  ORF type:complete len:218 (+),score=28.70 TRINITY_DN5148_c0_g2_i1:37-654(+)
MATVITLCVRNLPCKILEDNLAQIMVERGLDVSNYRMYFPKRSGRQGRLNNYGFGFVDCWRNEDAEIFIRLFHGYRFEGILSAKTLRVELGASSQVGNQIVEAMQPRNMDDSSEWAHSQTQEVAGNRAASYGHSRSNLDLVDSSWRVLSDSRPVAPGSEEVPATRLINSAHGSCFEGNSTSMCQHLSSCSSDQPWIAQERMHVWQ